MLLLRIYQKWLNKHFLVVQSVQTGALMAAGDAIAQLAIEKKKLPEFDLSRTAKFGFLGTCFVGPTLTVWYRLLAKQFGTSSSTSTALKKMACDQLIFAPTFLSIFIANVNFLSGKSVQDIKQELSRTYLDILIVNWKVWPAVQLVNFYCVPLNYQVLLVQGVALFWNTYLSWKTQKKVD
ncbi:protein Mpv17-like [Sitophilus oryzae]|uniref:Mitochondrial inner membrane protein Mpv17 n=1 Tax=Sitophilus oryzae TaxID=7048 RepID=A0A6J2XII1_SITOR|nr:protein Mpv17-like [Sitophilus oryzae]